MRIKFIYGGCFCSDVRFGDALKAVPLECADDAEAMERAKQLVDGHDVGSTPARQPGSSTSESDNPVIGLLPRGSEDFQDSLDTSENTGQFGAAPRS
jgi:hypothetical protein